MRLLQCADHPLGELAAGRIFRRTFIPRWRLPRFPKAASMESPLGVIAIAISLQLRGQVLYL
jgi:hypothetical protein